jgi:phosphocarrier protein HPr
MQRRTTVTAEEGLHARPAAVFVRAAAGAGVAVTIGRPDGPGANARSILAVLSLDVRQGEEVILTADGPGADAALEHLAALLSGAATAPSEQAAAAGGDGLS